MIPPTAYRAINFTPLIPYEKEKRTVPEPNLPAGSDRPALVTADYEVHQRQQKPRPRSILTIGAAPAHNNGHARICPACRQKESGILEVNVVVNDGEDGEAADRNCRRDHRKYVTVP